tara:strand:+ start:671 stop:886 length:216 start_codon:yes stop_codon:yes gene_type:complete
MGKKRLKKKKPVVKNKHLARMNSLMPPGKNNRKKRKKQYEDICDMFEGIMKENDGISSICSGIKKVAVIGN